MKISIKYLTLFALFFACSDIIAQNSNKTIPGFYIEGLRGGELSKADFLKADSIKCTDKTVIIEYFTISFQIRGDILEIISYSAEITPEMKNAIQNQGLTGKVWLDIIKATDGNGQALKQQTISFKLK